jgi:hypothetical protein
VHERLEADVGHRLANRAHVVERVLAGEHHALDPDLAHHARAARVVHRHLRRPVDLELGVDALDEPHDAEVLHDRGVDAAVYALAEVRERVGQLGGLDENVERQVHARAPGVRDGARLLELVERELGAVVPRVELRRPEVDRVGAVGHGGADRLERAGRGEEFWDGAAGRASGHKLRNIKHLRRLGRTRHGPALGERRAV